MQSTIRRALRAAGVRRSRVAAARMWCERNALALRTTSGGASARILCYHSVGTPPWGVNDVAPARFRRQIAVALDAGYRFVPAERIARGEAAPDELALTFDDGLRSVERNAAPLLGEMGIPWTMFIVSGWADGNAGAWSDGLLLGWRDVERLMAQGATIGSHSVTHRRMTGMGADELAHELGESRRTIGARVGVEPTSFAVPFGQSADWDATCQAAARDAGYETVYAQAVATRTPGTVARTFVGRFDGERVFRALLGGAFDRWEEWT